MSTIKSKSGGKSLSKCSMIIGTLWMIVMSTLVGLGYIQLNICDIIYVGIALVAIWSPIFLSIILDKVKDIKFDKLSISKSIDNKINEE